MMADMFGESDMTCACVADATEGAALSGESVMSDPGLFDGTPAPSVTFFGASGASDGHDITLTDPGSASAYGLAVFIADNASNLPLYVPPDVSWSLVYRNIGVVDGIQVEIWRKVSLVGSGSYTFINTFGVDTAAMLLAFDGATDIDVSAVNVNDTPEAGSPWHCTAPDVSATVSGMLIYLGCFDPANAGGGDVYTPPAGYTMARGQDFFFCTGFAAYKTVTPGATGTATGIDTRIGVTANAGSIGYHIVLKA